MKFIKQIFSLVLAIVLCGQVIVQAVGDGNIDGGGGGNLGGGNGNSSWSEVSAFDGSRREGVRVTVIDIRTNARASGTSTIDYTNTTTMDNATGFALTGVWHFGKNSKIDYKNTGKAMLSPTERWQGNYSYKNPPTVAGQSFPNIIKSGGNITAIKTYFCSEGVLMIIANETGISYKALTESGNYKLLLEPIIYFIYNGYGYAATSTELALFDAGLNGAIRSKLGVLTHNYLPFSMFLEAADLGFSAYTGSTGGGTFASNTQIVSNLGLGVVKFSPPPAINIETSVTAISTHTSSGGQQND